MLIVWKAYASVSASRDLFCGARRFLCKSTYQDLAGID